MAIRTVKIIGLEVTDATWTVLWDGATVANGAVVGGEVDVDHNCQVIGTWTFEDNGATELTEHSLSIAINSGVINAGSLWFSTAGINSEDKALGSFTITDSTACVGAGYWKSNNCEPFGDGSDTALADRSAILVNGDAPTVPADYEPAPTGTAENPTWTGWFFTIGAGDVLTCTARCPAQWTAPAPV